MEWIKTRDRDPYENVRLIVMYKQDLFPGNVFILHGPMYNKEYKIIYGYDGFSKINIKLEQVIGWNILDTDTKQEEEV